MRWGFRRSSTGAARTISPTGLLAEFVVVVAGILIALGADDWRQQRQERAIAAEHLSEVAFEISRNLWSVERVQQGLDEKRRGLERVLGFLDGGDAGADAENVLLAFAKSAVSPVPWLMDNRFKSLQNSGNLRLLRDPALANEIADSYAMAGVLFSQVQTLRSDYPAVVQGLLPAHMQAGTNPLSWYVPENVEAPRVEDGATAAEALDRIIARRTEIQSLARGEASVYTAVWYTLERMRRQFEMLLERLPPVDTSL